MYLRSVVLRDWKAYRSARFDFPAPDDGRNVILIGGQNGFGKTTLFEAIALGLFGRDGLALVSRAAAAADDQGRTLSYRNFLERALHGQALQQGRPNCHIGLTFEDEDRDPIVVERTWYFNDGGRFRETAEQVRITTGIGRRPVGPGGNEPDRLGWYRDWISRTFLPTHLANFFLFDGEAASVYAERDMGVQVREGIEGLLGLDWLRQLGVDLRDFARSRRGEVPRGVDDGAIQQLEQEIVRAEAVRKSAQACLDQINAGLAAAEASRDALTRELDGYGTGTRAQLGELIQERERNARAYSEAEERLEAIAATELPLALAGQTLRRRVTERLRGETARESWLASVSQGQSRVAGVLDSVSQRLVDVRPPLEPGQSLSVKQAVRESLDTLWYPPPENATDGFRHTHARGPMNDRVQNRLERAAKITTGTVCTLLDTMARTSAATRELDDAISATQVTAPQLEEKKRTLRDLNDRITGLAQEKGEKTNLLVSQGPELEQKRKKLGQLTTQLDQSLRPARLAKRAEEVAEMLDNLTREAWPLQADAVADAMTGVVRAMAHRSDYLNRVEIDQDGAVRLLTPDGRDLRNFDLSAGEKQIFTQALFAAIAQVSGRGFPLLIDTPVGRLDEDHRVNVLRHLAKRDSQVILLSTDTEVVGPYLDAIRPHVLKAYRIDNRRDGDIGTSWPVEGYFRGQGL